MLLGLHHVVVIVVCGDILGSVVVEFRGNTYLTICCLNNIGRINDLLTRDTLTMPIARLLRSRINNSKGALDGFHRLYGVYEINPAGLNCFLIAVVLCQIEFSVRDLALLTFLWSHIVHN